MIAAKAFIGAWGVVSVGASECTNTTLPLAQPATDVAVDTQGNVWFITAGGDDGNAVWRCAKDGDCKRMTGVEGQPVEGQPVGIAVSYCGWNDSTWVYVSSSHADVPQVKRCTFTDHLGVETMSCDDFQGGWTSPRGLTTDLFRNVYITDSAGDHQGVWKCSPSADCTLVGDSDGWQHFLPENVAVDSRGTVYVTSGNALGPHAGSIRRCTSDGVCEDGSVPRDFHWPWLHRITVAVDLDDSVYMSPSSGTYDLVRCPLGQDPCESIGAFDGGGSMAFSPYGELYVVQGPSEYDGLRRVCLSPAIKDVQV